MLIVDNDIVPQSVVSPSLSQQCTSSVITNFSDAILFNFYSYVVSVSLSHFRCLPYVLTDLLSEIKGISSIWHKLYLAAHLVISQSAIKEEISALILYSSFIAWGEKSVLHEIVLLLIPWKPNNTWEYLFFNFLANSAFSFCSLSREVRSVLSLSLSEWFASIAYMSNLLG